MNIDRLLSSVDPFAERVESVLRDLHMLDICSGLQMDHVCVRVEKEADVRLLHHQLERFGSTISTEDVNGRPVHIIQLDESLPVGGWQTRAIELPHPHPEKQYPDGWEHVEFVMPGVMNMMHGVRRALHSLFPHLENSGFVEEFQLKESNPHATGDQKPNPTISLTKNDVTPKLAVKFHALSIQEVVGYTACTEPV